MSGGVPAGWVLVPVEPTEAMLKAGAIAIFDDTDEHWTGETHQGWSAMLAATPTPPIEGRDADVERVEKVARAICTQQIPTNLHRFNRRGYVERHWHLYTDHASAALQAFGERG